MRRRCIVLVDGFFEWKAIKGQKAKQPYAIAMKDGSPLGLGGLCRTDRIGQCRGLSVRCAERQRRWVNKGPTKDEARLGMNNHNF